MFRTTTPNSPPSYRKDRSEANVPARTVSLAPGVSSETATGRERGSVSGSIGAEVSGCSTPSRSTYSMSWGFCRSFAMPVAAGFCAFVAAADIENARKRPWLSASSMSSTVRNMTFPPAGAAPLLWV